MRITPAHGQDWTETVDASPQVSQRNSCQAAGPRNNEPGTIEQIKTQTTTYTCNDGTKAQKSGTSVVNRWRNAPGASCQKNCAQTTNSTGMRITPAHGQDWTETVDASPQVSQRNSCQNAGSNRNQAGTIEQIKTQTTTYTCNDGTKAQKSGTSVENSWRDNGSCKRNCTSQACTWNRGATNKRHGDTWVVFKYFGYIRRWGGGDHCHNYRKYTYRTEKIYKCDDGTLSHLNTWKGQCWTISPYTKKRGCKVENAPTCGLSKWEAPSSEDCSEALYQICIREPLADQKRGFYKNTSGIKLVSVGSAITIRLKTRAEPKGITMTTK